MVIVERFSRWVEAVPTKDPDCRSAAKFLCKEIFPRFGFPDTISSGNGPAFVVNTIKVVKKKLGIKQKFGCVYQPDSDNKVSWVDALPLHVGGYHYHVHVNTS